MPGVTSTTTNLSPGVRVVVTPSQSSFFAGELFSVTVTFTNTHSSSQPSSRAHTHKRGAHSISSAPLARPPTSPGPPRTPGPSTSHVGGPCAGEDASVRRGLIGKVPIPQADNLPELLEQRRKRLLAKSLSVSIAPHELEEQVGEALIPKSAPYPRYQPSPLARSDTLALGSKHPHARKQSVVDAQVEFSTTPGSSTSTFSLALDPIVEGVLSPYPSTPSLASPTIDAPTSKVYAYHAQAGLGHGPPPSNPNSELVLYSYAQLKGTLSLTPLPGPLTHDQKQTLAATRAALLKPPVVGGGRMDISSSLHPQVAPGAGHRRRPTHSRTASFSSGLLTLISPNVPPSLSPSPSPSPGYASRPPSATTPRFPSSPLPPVGLGLGIAEDDIDPEVPLPTFEVQPAMLAVDLSLSPGESRSYTYTLPLPSILPPTFKGRTLRFAYELEVGTCRAGHDHLQHGGSTSRVMKVPIRVYNNVVVERTPMPMPMPYDVLWPLSKGAVGLGEGAKVVEVAGGANANAKIQTLPASAPAPAPTPAQGTLADLRTYAHRLLSSFPDPSARGVRIKLPAESVPQSPNPQSPHPPFPFDREREREQEGGCREAVEILTRSARKVSYDVNKDGVKVAVLTFVKGAYRLGETVVGVLEVNWRQGRARVVKLSAILETHESLPSTISPSPSPLKTHTLKRTHAEHHSSHLLSTLRTTFTLDIPSDASPAFLVRVGGEVPGGPATRMGGLEWKVRLCLLVAVAGEGERGGQGETWIGTEGVRMRGMKREGARGEWGSCWVATGGLAPMEKVLPMVVTASRAVETPNMNPKTMGWGAFLAASLFGNTGADTDADADADVSPPSSPPLSESEEEYDGIKAHPAGGVGMGVNYGGGEEGWRDVKMETVECEVPIRMWPGNTAFKAGEIVFDL